MGRGTGLRESLLLTVLTSLTACDASPAPAESGSSPAPASGEPVEMVAGDEESAGGATLKGPQDGVGSLAGRVIYRGALPATTMMYVPEAGNVEAHTIVVDRVTRGLKNAVVWIDGNLPAAAISGLQPAVLDQDNWTFVPHILAVRSGQPVQFMNSDISNHNVHSLSGRNDFNLGTPVGTAVVRRFRRPTKMNPVRLDCDIHDWMRAWVYVFPHDAFAVTEPSGRFRMPGIPAGRWQLRVHHADGALTASLEVVVKKEAETHVDIEVRPVSTERPGQ